MDVQEVLTALREANIYVKLQDLPGRPAMEDVDNEIVGKGWANKGVVGDPMYHITGKGLQHLQELENPPKKGEETPEPLTGGAAPDDTEQQAAPPAPSRTDPTPVTDAEESPSGKRKKSS